MDNKNFEEMELITEDMYSGEMPEEELQFRRPRKLRQKRVLFLTLIITACVLLAGVLGFVGYKLFFAGDKYDDSAAFYFTSDLLSENGGTYIAYGTIDFNLYNSADSLRISRENIENFTVKVKADGKDITKKAEITTGEKLMQADMRSTCAVSIDLPTEYHGKKIEVTAVSEPINITLKGSFVLESAWGYEIGDKKGNEVAELVIYANEDITLDLTWNTDELDAHSANPYVKSGNIKDGKCQVSLAAGMSTSIPLFKDDADKDYSKDKDVITIKENDKYVEVEELPEADTKTEEAK